MKYSLSPKDLQRAQAIFHSKSRLASVTALAANVYPSVSVELIASVLAAILAHSHNNSHIH